MKRKLSPSSTWEFVRRNLIWFLMLAYVLAAFVPGPGDALRQWRLGELPFSGHRLNPTHLLLAILLFCVGMSIRLGAGAGSLSPRRSIAAGLAASWLIPLASLGLLALLVGPFITPSVWGAFLIGAAVVVAMPPANSAAVWSEMSGDSPAFSVTTIILGTLLCPLTTPLILGLVASTSSPVGLTSAEMAGSLEVLTAFVVLPAAIGAACRYLLEAVRPERTAAVLTLVRSTSIVSLLTLNYANAAVALPRLALRGLAADALTVAVLSVALCAAVFGIALLVSRGGRAAHSDTGKSFVYITGMKNTGAALVLAASALGVHPLAALAPVFYTLAQHLAAALTDRLLCRGPASTIGTSMPKDAWTAEEDAIDEIDSRLDTGLRNIYVAAQTDA